MRIKSATGNKQLAAAFKVKSLGDDGTFAGYGSVFDHVDSYSDVVHRGAFRDSLKAWLVRKRDAQEWERKQVDALKTGAWADPKAGERTVREWCEIWMAAQRAAHSTLKRELRAVSPLLLNCSVSSAS